MKYLLHDIMYQRNAGLHQRHHAARCFSVSDGRLHGFEYQGVHVLSTKYRGCRSDFDRVSQRGSRSVHLELFDFSTTHARRLQRVSHHGLLRRPVWSRQRA